MNQSSILCLLLIVIGAISCAQSTTELAEPDLKVTAMPIVLNHTIVPAHDHEASARFFAKIFGLSYEGTAGHFAPVQVNDTLTLDFDKRGTFEPHHYAFHVSDADFDAIFARIKAEGISYGSGPRSLDDGQLNARRGGRGVYFLDPNGHVLELLTRP